MPGRLKYEAYKDESGGWRWRSLARNNEVIAVSSESYVEYRDLEHAVKLVDPGATIWLV